MVRLRILRLPTGGNVEYILAGGIAGSCYGTISNCTYEGDVLSLYGGGIAGANAGSVTDCTFDGQVGATYGAGIVAKNQGQLEQCAAYGSIAGFSGSAGIACESTGNITACYNQAEVYGDMAAGIVVAAEEILVEGCYNAGTIEGNEVGEIVLIPEDSLVENCYYLDSEAVDEVTEEAVEQDSINGEPVSPARMASGEITWKLNQALQETIYGQTLAGEKAERYPVFDSSTVYAVGVASCPGVEVEDAVSYSNDNTQIQYKHKNHLYEDGSYVCSFCGNVKEHTCQYEYGYCIHCSKLQKPEGNGTAKAPYEIGNEAELRWFVAKVSGMLDGEAAMPDAHAVLTDDIKLEAPESVADVWKPIGYNQETGAEYPYNGTFDGKGHFIGVVYGFSTDMKHLGFFTSIGENGIVRNLNICVELYNQPDDMSSSSMTGMSMSDVGVFGSVNKGIIENCAIDGTMELYNSGYSSIPISMNYVGGFCGINEGTIDRCQNYMEGIGVYNGNIGGICGMNTGTITNSYNMAEVYVNSGMPAGLVSFNSGRLAYSYNLGMVSGSTMPGPALCFLVMEGGSVEYCYAPESLGEEIDMEFYDVEGSVVSSSFMMDSYFENGALAYMYNKMQGEDVFGQVLSGETVSPEAVQVYPVISGPAVYPKEWYCPGEYSSINMEAGFTNDADYTVTYTYPDHDYGEEDENDYCGYCSEYKHEHDCEYDNGICTTCEMFKKPEGDGTKENPYQISNYGELCYFAIEVDGAYSNLPNLNACAVLVDDIVVNKDFNPQKQLDALFEEYEEEYEEDAVSEEAVELNEWWTIGEYSGITYEGTFDGGYHTITGLYCSPWTSGALFYRTGTQAVIKNLAIDNSLIAGESVAAGIALRNGGTIDSCSVNGIIYSLGYSQMSLEDDYSLYGTVGGICSINTGTISNCWVDAKIDLMYWDEDVTEYPAICFDSEDGTIDNCYYTLAEDSSEYLEYLEENDIKYDEQTWDGITYVTKEETIAGAVAWALDTCAGEKDRKNVWGQNPKTNSPDFIAVSADAVTLLNLERLDGTVEEYYVTKNSDLEEILVNIEAARWVYNGRQCQIEDGTVFAGDVMTYGNLALREEVAPTGSITIGDKTWESFKDVTAFDTRQIKNTSVTITVDSEDVKVEYLIYQAEDVTGCGLTMEELDGMEFALYDENTDLTVGDNGYVVIYVKLTDENGIINYISTAGLVVENPRLLSITAPEAITGVKNGTAKTAKALGLKDTVTIKTEDESVTSATVTWDLENLVSGSYDSSVTTVQTFTVSGKVVLPEDVDANGISLTVQITVTVTAADTVTPSPDPTGTPEPGPTGTPEPGSTGTPESGSTGTPEPGSTGTPEPGSTTSPDSSGDVMKGDVDDNGKVELSDAQAALKIALKIIGNPTEQQIKLADVNEDKAVDLADAQLILKYALKIINKFGSLS